KLLEDSETFHDSHSTRTPARGGHPCPTPGERAWKDVTHSGPVRPDARLWQGRPGSHGGPRRPQPGREVVRRRAGRTEWVRPGRALARAAPVQGPSRRQGESAPLTPMDEQ